MRSPCRSTCSFTWNVLTREPFLLPRSLSTQPSSSRAMRACWREMLSWGRWRSQSGARPITIGRSPTVKRRSRPSSWMRRRQTMRSRRFNGSRSPMVRLAFAAGPPRWVSGNLSVKGASVSSGPRAALDRRPVASRSMATVRVENPGPRDRRALLEVLALAFRDNPMNRAIHGPSPARRLRANRAGLRALVLDLHPWTQSEGDSQREGGSWAGSSPCRPAAFRCRAPRSARQLGCFFGQGLGRWTNGAS